MSWDRVKEISKGYRARRFRRPSLKGVRRIAIDEISLGNGHRHLTLVLDLEMRGVLFVGEGADAVRPCWGVKHEA